MTNLFESDDPPTARVTQLSSGVDPCRACGNPLQVCNWTCPKCGEIAERALFAAINPRKLSGAQRDAWQSGLVAGRTWYQERRNTEIDPANYHPTVGLEDYFRVGWKAGAEGASRPRGLHGIFRSPFNKFSERSVFEVVHDGRVVEEIMGLERLRTAIIQGHLMRSTPIRITRDRDGLILASDGKVKHLADIARRDLHVDSLYRPVLSYARRGAAWAFRIACVVQPLIWACLLFRTDPITALASLSLLITVLGVDFDDLRWWPFAPLGMFVIITYLSGDYGLWFILGAILLLATLAAVPAGICIGSLLGLVRAVRAPVAVDRVWENRTMTVIRTICVPLALLAALGAFCYFRWEAIVDGFEYFIGG